MPMQIDPIHKEKIESFPSELNEKSAGLHQVFSRDQLSRKAGIVQQPLQESEPSFWTKIKSWFTLPFIDSSEMNKKIEPLNQQREPFNFIPELDVPENYPKDLQEASLLPNKNRQTSFSQRDIMDIIDSLQDKTIDEIMMIVVSTQMELEKENALVVENCFTKLQHMRKIKENALLQIKEALLKDEKFLSKCTTAQNVAFAVSAISGLFATIVFTGLFPPTAVVTLIATFAPLAAAAATAAKGYSERRRDEDKAAYMQFSHEEKSITNWMDNARDQLQNFSDADQVFKDRIIKLIRRMPRLNRILMQNS